MSNLSQEELRDIKLRNHGFTFRGRHPDQLLLPEVCETSKIKLSDGSWFSWEEFKKFQIWKEKQEIKLAEFIAEQQRELYGRR